MLLRPELRLRPSCGAYRPLARFGGDASDGKGREERERERAGKRIRG